MAERERYVVMLPEWTGVPARAVSVAYSPKQAVTQCLHRHNNSTIAKTNASKLGENGSLEWYAFAVTFFEDRDEDGNYIPADKRRGFEVGTLAHDLAHCEGLENPTQEHFDWAERHID